MGSATTDTSQNTPEIAVTSVRIEKSKLARFKAVAEANRRSVSQQLRWLIDQDIKDHPDVGADLRTDGEANGGAA